MYKMNSLVLSVLLVIIPTISMEHSNKSDLLSPFAPLPVDVSIGIVARCESKNALRQTCKYFHAFASRIKNEKILVQPSLHLSQEALDRYLLYYGALGNTAIVRNLLDKGANLSAREDNGMELMDYAIKCDYGDIADMLLEHSAFIISDILNPKKFSSHIVQHNRLSVAERVLLSRENDDGEVLCYAIKNGLYNRVKTLLAHNVNVNAVNKKGKYLLSLAAKGGYINIMKLLIANGAQVRSKDVWRAVLKGDTNAIQLFVDYGIDCDLNGENSWITLHEPSHHGYIQIIKILLSKGVCVNKMNKTDGVTPLHEACGSLQADSHIIKILLKYGADVNARDCFGSTPLHYACNWARPDRSIIEMLLEHGADVMKRNCFGATALDEALDKGIKDLFDKHVPKPKEEFNECKCAIQ